MRGLGKYFLCGALHQQNDGRKSEKHKKLIFPLSIIKRRKKNVKMPENWSHKKYFPGPCMRKFFTNLEYPFKNIKQESLIKENF